MQFIAPYQQHKTHVDEAPCYCVIIFDKMWGKHYLSKNIIKIFIEVKFTAI